MDHRSFCIHDHHIEIFFVLCVFLVDGVLCLSSNSTTCAPQNCGKGPNIEYPFWIESRQEPSCGSPGFGIACKDRNPVLKISGDDYVIMDIFYANDTLLLSQPESYDGGNPCPTPKHNFTVEGTSPFSYSPETVDLFFLYNCTLPYDKEAYAVDCASNLSRHSFAVFHPEILEHLNYSIGSCQAMINAPVTGDAIETLLHENFSQVLKRGFALQWDGERDGRGDNIPLKIAIGLGAFILCALAFTLIPCLRHRGRSLMELLIFKKKTKEEHNLEDLIRQYGSLAPERYPYSYIKKMTTLFRDKLGQGGYGTVYRGKLLDGRLVAIKLLNVAKESGEEFINEVLSIGRTSHVNVVRLLGFCMEGKRRALVYEYMPNGSLEKYIHSKRNDVSSNQLQMDKLYQISLGVARGLEYLHRGCNTRIMHFDIKPHNILLDEYFRPKISDFGMAKQCKMNESMVSILGARGTIGYIAPELVSRAFGVVSYKSDVYSYGMMILEIVGRRKNVYLETSRTSEVYFPHWVYQHLVIDDDLRIKDVTSEEDEIARKMILVGLWCVQNDPSQRPTMSKVIEMLEGDLQAIPMPPKSFFDFPSTPPQPSSTTCTTIVTL